MRPVEIVLSGFGSYEQEQRVDFSEVGLACITGHNGAGKCLPGGTRVYDAGTGEVLPIERFVAERRKTTFGLTGGRVAPVEVTDWLDLGEKPVVKLRLSSGATLTTATTHPVLTDQGCIPAGELTRHHWVAEVKSLPAAGSARLSVDEAMLLGLLLGDGHLAYAGIQLSNIDPDIVDLFRGCIERLFPGARVTSSDQRSWLVVNGVTGDERRDYIRRMVQRLEGIGVPLERYAARNRRAIAAGAYGLGWDTLCRIEEEYGIDLYEERCTLHAARAVVEWVRGLGLLGTRSATKFIPSDCLLLPDEQAWALLAGLWLTDGWFFSREGSRGGSEVAYGSISRQLVEDVRVLLLRVGVASTLTSSKRSHRVHVRSSDIDKLEQMPLEGRKAVARDNLLAGYQPGAADPIPPSFNSTIPALVSMSGKTRTRAQLSDHALSRAAFVDFGGDPAVAAQETTWSRVVSVELAAAPVPCFDLTVDTPEHLFIAETVIVHNSSLFQAMAFALFGYTGEGDIDSIVHDRAKTAEVGFVFDHGGERYRVVRGRSRGRSTMARLERYVDGDFVVLVDSGPRAVDPAIRDLIRIEAETFISTTLMSQDDSGRFARAKAAERKKILSDILELDDYQLLAKAARERAGAARKSHEQLQKDVDKLDAQLSGADTDTTALVTARGRMGMLEAAVMESKAALEKAAAELTESGAARERLSVIEEVLAAGEAARARRQTEIAQARTRAAAALQAADAAISQADRRLQQALAASSELAGLQDGVLRGEVALSEREKGEEAIIAAGVECSAAMESEVADIARLSRVAAEARERLEVLGRGEAQCYTCGQELSGETRSAVIAKVEAEIEALDAAITNAERRHLAAEQKRDELRLALKACRGEKQQAKIHLDGARSLLADRSNLAATKEAAQTELARLQHERGLAGDAVAAADAMAPAEEDEAALVTLAAEATQLRAAIAAEDGRAAARQSAEAALRALEAEHATLLQKIGTLTERMTTYEALRTERERAIEEARSAARDAEDWGALARAYGPDGVPNLIFAGATRELERDAADVMGRLSGGRYRLEMRTEMQNKSDGETKGTLEVVVVADTGAERPFSRLSGGERFRVALALHTALTRFLVRRSGAPIEFLAVDEGWGSLDPEGILAMLDALRTLHAEFPLILTVTHTPEVAAAFDCQYEVRKDAAGSSMVELRVA